MVGGGGGVDWLPLLWLCWCRCGHGLPLGRCHHGCRHMTLLLQMEGCAVLRGHGVAGEALLLAGGHQHVGSVFCRALGGGAQLWQGQLVWQGQAEGGHQQVMLLTVAVHCCCVAIAVQQVLLGVAAIVVVRERGDQAIGGGCVHGGVKDVSEVEARVQAVQPGVVQVQEVEALGQGGRLRQEAIPSTWRRGAGVCLSLRGHLGHHGDGAHLAGALLLPAQLGGGLREGGLPARGVAVLHLGDGRHLSPGCQGAGSRAGGGRCVAAGTADGLHRDPVMRNWVAGMHLPIAHVAQVRGVLLAPHTGDLAVAQVAAG
mmetsp:Transcript_18231/g.51078  ORF Transcript_18231/g.51078 Transcript_18231/m.51078 type:complete len:314 (+) Transcript_18231:1590-2531(+)